MEPVILDRNVKILFEDKDILVVVKPAGVATQSSRIGEMDLVSLLRNYRVGKGESDYIGMIHRLDQPVGGILVFAKNSKAAASLSKQVQDRSMEKYYKALVCGSIEKEGTLQDYLLKDGKSNQSRIVKKETPGAKPASLSFKKEAEAEGISQVEIKLATGRHHQIRVQMAHHGFPLVGDRKYNPGMRGATGRGAGPGRDTGTGMVTGLDATALALFAWKLRFKHPRTGELLEFFEKEPWKLVKISEKEPWKFRV